MHRDKSRLPVVAVDDIRLEADHRQGWESRLAEEGKLLQIVIPVPIRAVTPEITLIINKIEGHALIFIFQDAHIPVLSQIIHIKMIHILHFIAEWLFDAQILRDHDTHIKILLIKTFWKGSDNVCQTSCFDKWNRLRCNKQNILHSYYLPTVPARDLAPY